MDESSGRSDVATGDDRADQVGATMPHASGETLLSTPEHARERIGPYRLVDVIGEGGFGTVWRAEQREPVRRMVALKILKPGMGSSSVLGRFEAERQVLAMMDHPGIAIVFDAGTTDDGRPYFAMELVRGEAITDYCDRCGLGPTGRAELIASVCLAVQHAHQKGVIHRDLKPSNVLVTEQDGRPVPKVIDFGIAKATGEPLTDRTIVTEFRQLIGTPEYMSPEQAREGTLDIDTRSDVYALGVLLYELLTGTTPLTAERLRRASPLEIQRLISEEDPPRPSTRLSSLSGDDQVIARRRGRSAAELGRQLRGDLDWIVMRAIEKDRSRRYATAKDFAEDIHNFLARRPVNARPPSTAYRLRRLSARHRALTAAIVSASLALLLGAGTATIGFVRARDEADRARRAERAAIAAREATAIEAAKATAINDFLTNMLRSVDPDEARGRTVTVESVLADASARLDAGAFQEQPEVLVALRRTLARTFDALGRYDAVRDELLAVLSIEERLHGPSAPEVAGALEELGGCLVTLGELEAAEARLTRADAIRRATLGPDYPPQRGIPATLGWVHYAAGRFEEAETFFRAAVERSLAHHGPGHLVTLSMRSGLANAVERLGASKEAIEQLELVVAGYRDHYGPVHTLVAAALNNLANALEGVERYEQAERHHREALEIRRALLDADHPDISYTLGNLGLVLHRLGRLDEAEALFRESLAIKEASLPPEHLSTAITWNNLSLTLVDLDRPAEALEAVDRALAMIERSLPADHLAHQVFGGNRGAALTGLGRFEEAEALLLATHRTLEQRHGTEYRRTRRIAELLADCYAKWDRPADAARWAEFAREPSDGDGTGP